MRLLFLAAAALMLPGCVRTVAGVMTAPVKVVSQGADWATTSQDEADRNRGREIRKQEEREARERRRQDERQQNQ
jgi:UPF0716 family protein affecting phage T7 exclusion